MYKILVVEDEINAREGLKDILGKYNNKYQVTTAIDGLDGLNKAQSYLPDIIITDIRMPKIDGIQMVKRIRELNLNVEILILSGYAEFEYAKSALSLSVVDYILKPIVPNTMFSQLEKCIQKITEKNKLLPTFQRNSYPLLSENDNNMLSSYYIDKGINELLCIIMYSKSGSLFKPYWRASVLENPNAVLINSYDTSYMGIFIPSKDPAAKNILASCKRSRNIASSTTGIYNYVTCNQETNWFLVFQQLASSIPWSISLNSNFFEFKDYMMEESKNTSDISDFKKSLKKHFYKQEYDLCQSKIISFLKDYQDGSYHPDYIKILAASFILDTSTSFHNSKKNNAFCKNTTIKNIMSTNNFYELKMLISNYYNSYPLLQKANDYSKPVWMAVSYIQQNYHKPVSLQSTAEVIGVTPQYLSSLFSQEIKQNFIDYLTSYRMQIAKQLLDTTDIKIFEIASQIGYNDAKYFCTTFKKYEGISPNQYRRNRNI